MGECREDVYKNGEHVATVASIPSTEIEAWVIKIRELAGEERVDWHYVGGRGVVRALGDVERIRKVIGENPPDTSYFNLIGPIQEGDSVLPMDFEELWNRRHE